MLLTISTTHRPATDLGYLLHKNPARPQELELTFGRANVFYPVVSEERCTAALAVEVDPIALVRGRRPGQELLEQYVNDRPYAASSFLSVALGQAFSTAMTGRSKERQALADSALPLVAQVFSVPCAEADLPLRLFGPLGYEVVVQQSPLDETFPEWGPSPYATLTLSGHCRLADLLAHLYVLMPVLDDQKHYWVGDAEVEKLLHRGAGWLAQHPEKQLIATRYLKHQRGLATDALERLLAEEASAADSMAAAHDRLEASLEQPLRLEDVRCEKVMELLAQHGARTILDLGCGEGKFVAAAVASRKFTKVVGLEVSQRALERARERCAQLTGSLLPPWELLHGSLLYRDARLAGADAAVAIEVIEHFDAERVPSLTRNLLECIRPQLLIVTTPNRDYNPLLARLPAGQLRHRDHRFEWTRAEFRSWAEAAAAVHGYTVAIVPVGDADAQLGAPTQLAVFVRAPESPA